MLKSFFEWLTSVRPIQNWVLLIFLLGLIIGLAAEIKAYSGRDKDKISKEM